MDKPIVQNFQANAQVYTDMQGLNDLRRTARMQTAAAIPEVAKQFEAVFMQMVLKSMRSATMGDPLLNSSQTETYTDLLDKQMTLQMSQKGGLGLAELIAKQLQSKVALTDVSATPVAHDLGLKPLNALPPVLNSQVPAVKSLSTTDALKAIEDKLSLLKLNPIKTPSLKTKTPAEFVKSIWPEVKAVAKKLGVNPMAIMAQAALETGWGKSIPKTVEGESSNNLFGIKASKDWGGSTVSAVTKEIVQGKELTTEQKFRSYSSITQSIEDYGQLLLSNPRYEKALKQGKSVEEFAKAMQESGYATDPAYGRKLQSVAASPILRDVMRDLVM